MCEGSQISHVPWLVPWYHEGWLASHLLLYPPGKAANGHLGATLATYGPEELAI
jgi:hypothetical protein